MEKMKQKPASEAGPYLHSLADLHLILSIQRLQRAAQSTLVARPINAPVKAIRRKRRV